MRFFSAVFLLVLASFAACSGGASTSDPVERDASVDARFVADATADAAHDGAGDSGVDAATCSPRGSCSPFVETSCASGESCRPVGEGGAFECAPLAQTIGGEGAPCSRGDGCGRGLLCVGEEGSARCTKVCPAGSVGYCGGENRCTGTLGDACVKTCRTRPTPCDIYADACLDPTACSFASDSETEAPYTACLSEGTRAAGETCGGADGQCQRGHVCIRSDAGTSACRKVCRPEGGSPGCGTSEACTGYAEPWATGYCKPSFE